MLSLALVLSCAGIFSGWGDNYWPLLVSTQNNKEMKRVVEPHIDARDVKIIVFIPYLMSKNKHFACWSHFSSVHSLWMTSHG